jgi:hypothetical protein
MGTPSIARHVSLIVLVALAAVTGCQRSRSANGVSDATFVAVMADLKRVQDAPGSNASQKAARRDSVLQSRGLTPGQLEQAARELAQNPTRAQTVWQAVQRRAADTTAKAVAPPAPAAASAPK